MSWIVWRYSYYNDVLSYEEYDSCGEAMDAAVSLLDSDYESLSCVERPDGSAVHDDDVEAWRKNRREIEQKRCRNDPPKPPVATLTVKAPMGGQYVEQLYADHEDAYQKAVERFGADRASLVIHPPTTLVWRGTYRNVVKVNFEQRKINESREHFGKPILCADSTHEDSFECSRVWHEGDVTDAQIVPRSGVPLPDIEVRGTSREAVEAMVTELAETWKALNEKA